MGGATKGRAAGRAESDSLGAAAAANNGIERFGHVTTATDEGRAFDTIADEDVLFDASDQVAEWLAKNWSHDTLFSLLEWNNPRPRMR